MRNRLLLIVGFVTYLVFLCAYAPAQLLGSLVTHFGSEHISLAAAQGSFWKGDAHLLLQAKSAEAESPLDIGLDIGKVAWDIQPLQLLTGKLAISLSWNDGAPFWFTLDASRAHVEHVTLNLPATVIQQLVPTLRAARLGGQLSLRCDNFSVTKKEMLGLVEIDWAQVTSPLSTLNPLGSYHARVEGVGEVLNINLNTVGDGPLLLQSSGRWSANNGASFEGTASAHPSAKGQLQDILRIMGNETSAGSGSYQIKF